jgi:hypothetical protein
LRSNCPLLGTSYTTRHYILVRRDAAAAERPPNVRSRSRLIKTFLHTPTLQPQLLPLPSAARVSLFATAALPQRLGAAGAEHDVVAVSIVKWGGSVAGPARRPAGGLRRKRHDWKHAVHHWQTPAVQETWMLQEGRENLNVISECSATNLTGVGHTAHARGCSWGVFCCGTRPASVGSQDCRAAPFM